MSFPRPDYSADVWSVACILVECLTRTVLFRGNDTIDQFVKIVTRRGYPRASFLALIESASTRAFIERFLGRMPEPWVHILGGVHDEHLEDLLEHMLAYGQSGFPFALPVWFAFFVALAACLLPPMFVFCCRPSGAADGRAGNGASVLCHVPQRGVRAGVCWNRAGLGDGPLAGGVARAVVCRGPGLPRPRHHPRCSVVWFWLVFILRI